MDTKDKKFTLWPYAVVLGLVLFMGYIVYFVILAMKQDVDLVSKDYYAQEIAYQDHIDKVGRTQVAGDVEITYDPAAQHILFQLPDTYQGQRITGKITFFRPSDDKLDQEVALQLGRDRSQLIETNELEKGLWKVRVNFSTGEETYYTEKRIRIE
jgi:nitrogen fixation protein FixH